jgi:transcriptional regulator with XRE-family HTH domain
MGDLLREWRKLRKLSQLDLAELAEISGRHLSFIENGRSAPSRVIVLRLAEALGLALRERNKLLLAAGYAPVYDETNLEAPRMAAIRAMVRQLLTAHEPYPGGRAGSVLASRRRERAVAASGREWRRSCSRSRST